MTLSFTASEIFELAERIEREGASFYRRAAELVGDATTRAKLLQLAEWESSHENLFAQARGGLDDRQRQPLPQDPDDDTLLYLNAMGARHVLNQGRTVLELLPPGASIQEVLDLAITFETDSIALFQGLAAHVPVALGADRVRHLIAEEIGHVAYLVRERERVGDG